MLDYLLQLGLKQSKKNYGPTSTILRVLTQKYGNLSTFFDKIDESEAGIDNSSLKQMLINIHTIDVKRGLLKGHLLSEHVFEFCVSFKKRRKGLGFELELRT